MLIVIATVLLLKAKTWFLKSLSKSNLNVVPKSLRVNLYKTLLTVKGSVFEWPFKPLLCQGRNAWSCCKYFHGIFLFMVLCFNIFAFHKKPINTYLSNFSLTLPIGLDRLSVFTLNIEYVALASGLIAFDRIWTVAVPDWRLAFFLQQR